MSASTVLISAWESSDQAVVLSDNEDQRAIPRLWTAALTEDAVVTNETKELPPSSQSNPLPDRPDHNLFARLVVRQLLRNQIVALIFSVLLTLLGALIADRLIIVGALAYALGHIMNGLLTRIAMHHTGQSLG